MSKELVFQSVESLQQVVNVINEAATALYGLGTVGLSAVGITSDLATIGSVVGGTARNKINGVSDWNPNGPYYNWASTAEFGALPDNSPARMRLW